MTHRFTTILISVLGLQAPMWAHAADPAPTEAPAGFDTPTLIAAPGSKPFRLEGSAQQPALVHRGRLFE